MARSACVRVCKRCGISTTTEELRSFNENGEHFRYVRKRTCAGPFPRSARHLKVVCDGCSRIPRLEMQEAFNSSREKNECARPAPHLKLLNFPAKFRLKTHTFISTECVDVVQQENTQLKPHFVYVIQRTSYTHINRTTTTKKNLINFLFDNDTEAQRQRTQQWNGWNGICTMSKNIFNMRFLRSLSKYNITCVLWQASWR